MAESSGNMMNSSYRSVSTEQHSAPRIRRSQPSPRNIIRSASPTPMETEPVPEIAVRLEDTASIYETEIPRKHFYMPDVVRERVDESRRFEEEREYELTRPGVGPPMCYEEWYGPRWEPPTPPPYRSSRPTRPPVDELWPPSLMWQARQQGSLKRSTRSGDGAAAAAARGAAGGDGGDGANRSGRRPTSGGSSGRPRSGSSSNNGGNRHNTNNRPTTGSSSLNNSLSGRRSSRNAEAMTPRTPRSAQDQHLQPSPRHARHRRSQQQDADETQNRTSPAMERSSLASSSAAPLSSPASVVVVLDPELVRDLETAEFRTRTGISQSERPLRNELTKKCQQLQQMLQELQERRDELMVEEGNGRAEISTGQDQEFSPFAGQAAEEFVLAKKKAEAAEAVRKEVEAAEAARKQAEEAAEAARKQAEEAAAAKEKAAIEARDSEEGVKLRRSAIENILGESVLNASSVFTISPVLPSSGNATLLLCGKEETKSVSVLQQQQQQEQQEPTQQQRPRSDAVWCLMGTPDCFVTILWNNNSVLGLTAPLDPNEGACQLTDASLARKPGAISHERCSANRQLFSLVTIEGRPGSFMLQPKSDPTMYLEVRKSHQQQQQDDSSGGDNEHQHELYLTASPVTGASSDAAAAGSSEGWTRCSEFSVAPVEEDVKVGPVVVSRRMDRDAKKKEREAALKEVLGDNDINTHVFGIAPAVSAGLRYTLEPGVEDEDELDDEAEVQLVIRDGTVGKNPAQQFQFQPTGAGYVALCTAMFKKQKRCIAVEKDDDNNCKFILVPYFGADCENYAQFSVLLIKDEGMFTLESRQYVDFVFEPQLDQEEEPMSIKMVPATNASDFCEMEMVEPL